MSLDRVLHHGAAPRSYEVAAAEQKAGRFQAMTAGEVALLSQRKLEFVCKAYSYQAAVAERLTRPANALADSIIAQRVADLRITANRADLELARRAAQASAA